MVRTFLLAILAGSTSFLLAQPLETSSFLSAATRNAPQDAFVRRLESASLGIPLIDGLESSTRVRRLPNPGGVRLEVRLANKCEKDFELERIPLMTLAFRMRATT